MLNKMDIAEHDEVEQQRLIWQEDFPQAKVIPFSAKFNWNLETLMTDVISYLPESEPYFGKDDWTDRPERFFVTEVIREKILMNYKQEIPYSCEVVCSYLLYGRRRYHQDFGRDICGARESETDSDWQKRRNAEESRDAGSFRPRKVLRQKDIPRNPCARIR